MLGARPAMTAERIASALGARKGLPSDSNEAAAFGHARGSRHRDDYMEFSTISAGGERLHVAPRTVRRWIVAGDLARPIRESAVFWSDWCVRTPPLTRRTGLPSAFHRLTTGTLQRA